MAPRSRQSTYAGPALETTTTAPVPLPAGGLLTLTGFGGVATARKRRTASI
ncbi:VPLPA-CTERM sorting domain-containing protein [Primorskyibacter sp. S187A]|uniref:VPLPA-CTERM sorting domain-containing protein n=1 Tax=Primorskyibacter sp. S187A TaxID=3415130 RepID=UPI003C7CA977